MKEELKYTCENCSVDVPKYESFCSKKCEEQHDKKTIKKYIFFTIVCILSVTLFATMVIEFETQIADFFNVIGEYLRSAFYSIPSFFQTFLTILFAILSIVCMLFMLTIMRTDSRY